MGEEEDDVIGESVVTATDEDVGRFLRNFVAAERQVREFVAAWLWGPVRATRITASPQEQVFSERFRFERRGLEQLLGDTKPILKDLEEWMAPEDHKRLANAIGVVRQWKDLRNQISHSLTNVFKEGNQVRVGPRPADVKPLAKESLAAGQLALALATIDIQEGRESVRERFEQIETEFPRHLRERVQPDEA